MTLSIFIIYLFVLFCVVDNFNFDVDFPIVYTDPFSFNGQKLPKSSYFGYSVILSEGASNAQPWLQIGAPRGANPFLSDETSGVVFRCGIKKQCSFVRLKTERERGISRYAFMGNSMDISDDKKRYAVCGHRWIEAERRDYWMQGACVWSNVAENSTHLLTPFYGLAYNNCQIDYVGGRAAYNYAQGQSGFSAHFSRYKKDTELVLGAPGSYNWHGAPLIYRTETERGPIASRHYAPRRHRRNAYDLESLNIASGKKITETLIFDLLGYSVTSGYFFHKDIISYVTGAPKAGLVGKVLVFKFSDDNYEGLHVEQTRQGVQVGEYFGSSLAAGDINNDGYDDLLVGAPLYKGSKYDEGRVYLFLGSPSKSLITPEKRSIDGKAPGGRFGQNIMYLGDIDFDDYGDVAIAAPYEDEGSGVIYIYRGASNGLNTEEAQRLVGKSFEPTIKSFGISISKPADIDGNKYNDIAVGAYLSGHTVLLRGRILVTIEQTIVSNIDKINYDSGNFVFTSCIRHRGYGVQGPISVQRSMVIDETYRRANLQPGFPATDTVTLLKIGEYVCKDVTVNIKENITNRYNPLSIDISLELITSKINPGPINIGRNIVGIDNFCTFCPVVNNFTSEMKKQRQVPFSLGCRDNVCYSELILTSSFLNLASSGYYTIGSRKYLTLQTDVKNKGENAHLTELFISLPMSVRLRSIPSSCSEYNSTHIKCDVANTLKPNQEKTITLELDMQEVNSGKYEGMLNFNLTVTTSSENSNNNVQQLSLALLREADVAISGKSKEQSYSYGNITHGKSEFMQIYQMEKFGVSPIDQVILNIWIPTVVATSTGDIKFVQVYPPIGSLGGQPLTCQSNITYVVDDIKGLSTDVIDRDEANQTSGPETLSPVRRRRTTRSLKSEKYQTEATSDLDYPLNRTLYLNCSGQDVDCEKIVCTAGPFRSTHDVAELQLKMKIDVSNLADYLGERDIVVVSTNGALTISNTVQSNGIKRPHEVSVPSIFIGPTVEHSIPIWIIIVAVICGILLLLLIIAGLYKAGFFNRENKKKLEEEKMMKDEEETGMTSEHKPEDEREE